MREHEDAFKNENIIFCLFENIYIGEKKDNFVRTLRMRCGVILFSLLAHH
jgi:hypothetical protein